MNEWSGARWWKCDFHIHGGESHDYGDKRNSKEWAKLVLEQARIKDLDAIAITDHNQSTGVEQVIETSRKEGFDSIVIFPAVEVTVSGFHVLALFPPISDDDSPRKGTDCVSDFLSSVGIVSSVRGVGGAHAPGMNVFGVLSQIGLLGGVAILAHVFDKNGAWFETKSLGSERRNIFLDNNIFGIEMSQEPVLDTPEYRKLETMKKFSGKRIFPLAGCAFSDAHNPKDVGRRVTWFKMSKPSIEGLKLAMSDGHYATVPVWSGQNPDLNKQADNRIVSIEIGGTKLTPEGRALSVPFNPWMNAIIGGRGTGKSTVVDCLRLSHDREATLPESLRAEFQQRARVPDKKNPSGLLCSNTKIVVEWVKSGARLRLLWGKAGKGAQLSIEEFKDGGWMSSPGAVSSRFPIRILSQKEIYESAHSLSHILAFIDESPEVNSAKIVEEVEALWGEFSIVRNSIRRIESEIEKEPQLKGRLSDENRRIEAIEASGYRDDLHRFKIINDYKTEISRQEERMTAFYDRMINFVDRQMVPTHRIVETEENIDIVELLDELATQAEESKRMVVAMIEERQGVVSGFFERVSQSDWSVRAAEFELEFNKATSELLEEHPFTDILAGYHNAMRARGELLEKLRHIESRKEELKELLCRQDEILKEVSSKREYLLKSRQGFVDKLLETNPRLRMMVVPYGDFDNAKLGLRKSLEISGDSHSSVVGDAFNEQSLLGMVYDGKVHESIGKWLSEWDVDYSTSVKNHIESKLKKMKEFVMKLRRGGDIEKPASKRFVTHLQRRHDSDFDHLLFWLPNDSLHVEYYDHDGFKPINQGSAGQKTAALLSFIVSYGKEPLIIDQPEDDLDNRLINSLIVEHLRSTKNQRQIIIVTHNPNIVVNGDVENVISLDVSDGGAKINSVGSLQELKVRQEICRVMEGGEEAFERRYRRLTVSK